jgi:hypothetical protein
MVEFVVNPPSKAGDAQQLGNAFQVAKPPLLRGTCVTTDNRVLADAEVEAHASAFLYSLKGDERDERRWGRTVRTRTNGAGEFVLPVDPNSTYDVVVRPATGTGFPWTILSGVKIAQAPQLQLQPITIPAPAIVDLVLNSSPTDFPVSHALVRAFVEKQSASPEDYVAFEIGRTRTDEAGRFQLYLTETPTAWTP